MVSQHDVKVTSLQKEEKVATCGDAEGESQVSGFLPSSERSVLETLRGKRAGFDQMLETVSHVRQGR